MCVVAVGLRQLEAMNAELKDLASGRITQKNFLKLAKKVGFGKTLAWRKKFFKLFAGAFGGRTCVLSRFVFLVLVAL